MSGNLKSADADVVIVGAGPVGLVAACELARRGVAIRIIDKRSEPIAESRAVTVHARSLDMLDRMGVVKQLMSTGNKVSGMQMYASGRKLLRVPFNSVDSLYPFAVITPQTETERVLTEQLSSLGVTIERGVELVALTQDADAAHLCVRHADGSAERLDSGWVIGADGARSTVRRSVGSTMDGSFDGERYLLGDVVGDHALPLNSMYTFFAAAGPVVVLPMRDGRMRVLAQVPGAPRQPLNKHPTQDSLQAILDQRVGGIIIRTSRWLTEFETHRGHVPTYRYNRVFLAGDAAHLHPPAGGQGMNTGMQDAFNLAWKLAATVYGHGGDLLLDSYSAERHPIAMKVISFTTRLNRIATLSGLSRRIRDTAMWSLSHVRSIQHTMANEATEVNVAYPDSPIVVSRRPRSAKVQAGEHIPRLADADLQQHLDAVCRDVTGHVILTIAPYDVPRVATPAGAGKQVLVTTSYSHAHEYDSVVSDPTRSVAKRYGLERGGRVAVRPDGYIGAITDMTDTHTLPSYFAHLCSTPSP